MGVNTKLNTETGEHSGASHCSAYVLLSVRVDNLFTREQREGRGIDEHDMVLECFDNLYDLVANSEELTVKDIAVRWPNVVITDRYRNARSQQHGKETNK
jgi:hypothetical protein